MKIVPPRPKQHVDEVYYWKVKTEYPFEIINHEFDIKGELKRSDCLLITPYGYVVIYTDKYYNQVYCRFIHDKREYSLVLHPFTDVTNEVEKIAKEWAEQIVQGVYASPEYDYDNQMPGPDN